MDQAIVYPVGQSSFEDLRADNAVYVDKTALIYQLVKQGRFYFLSRPRRFGKSLLVSTLETYFLGKRELFAGLAMERLERGWTQHPVLHVDFSLRGLLRGRMRGRGSRRWCWWTSTTSRCWTRSAAGSCWRATKTFCGASTGRSRRARRTCGSCF